MTFEDRLKLRMQECDLTWYIQTRIFICTNPPRRYLLLTVLGAILVARFGEADHGAETAQAYTIQVWLATP